MPTYNHYFIRHAHRNPFKPNDWGNEVSITPEGKRSSEELGRQFAKTEIKTIWSSPIKRCIQTGEAIKKGMKSSVSITPSVLLGDPGFMISDPTLVGEAFRNHALPELVDQLLEGKTLDGFHSVAIGCKNMLGELLNNRQSEAIWVSHDINVAILACWIFRSNRSEAMIPDFLEGIKFSFSEEGMFAYFKGLRTKIDETAFRGI